MFWVFHVSVFRYFVFFEFAFLGFYVFCFIFGIVRPGDVDDDEGADGWWEGYDEDKKDTMMMTDSNISNLVGDG